MSVQITSLYAGLLALVCVFLAGSVGALRAKKKISLGDNGDAELIVANRRHMNFVEYVPLALLLIALVEVNGTSATWVHGLGATLLVGRIVHPFGIDINDMMRIPRFIGAAATMLVTIAAAAMLIWGYFN